MCFIVDSKASFLYFLILLAGSLQVNGHGRLMWPPGRGTVFRHKEFSHLRPRPNYGDHALNCGGHDVQYGENNGKCGECGDNYQQKRPRPNESGGIYDSHIITNYYHSGQEIAAHVQLTANHGGYFEFRLCQHNNPGIPEEETCFGENLVEIIGSDGTNRTFEWVVPRVYQYHLTLKLPDKVSCFQCILQWNYRAGNNWGLCPNGVWGRGCASDPETFRGCSDIAIGAEQNEIEIGDGDWNAESAYNVSTNVGEDYYSKAEATVNSSTSVLTTGIQGDDERNTESTLNISTNVGEADWTTESTLNSSTNIGQDEWNSESTLNLSTSVLTTGIHGEDAWNTESTLDISSNAGEDEWNTESALNVFTDDFTTDIPVGDEWNTDSTLNVSTNIIITELQNVTRENEG